MNERRTIEERVRSVELPERRDPPTAGIIRRGHRRRIRRLAASSLAIVILAAGVMVPIGAMLASRLDTRATATPTVEADPAAPVSGPTAAAPGPTQEVPVGLGVVIDVPERWSLLLRPGAAGRADVFQLTNFDPALFLQGHAPDAAGAAWRCPLTGGALPDDGALLIVRMTTADRASAVEPSWPVDLVPGANECGAGLVAAWRVRDRGFDAFAAFGPSVRDADRTAMLDVFATARYGQSPDWFIDTDEDTAGLPQLVLSRSETDGVVWLQVVYPETTEIAASGWCHGVIESDPSTPPGTSSGPSLVTTGADCADVGALAEGPVANFGYGGSCEGMMSLEGIVRQDIRRAYLRMPDGIEVPLSIATPPLGLETDHKNLVAGVFRGSGGTFVGIDADGQPVEGPRVTC